MGQTIVRHMCATGEPSNPSDLETVLGGCADICEAAVVGRRDDKLGEVPVACVVPVPGRSLTREQVIALFDGKLATYKHPRDVIFLDALLRNTTGEVQKTVLRDLVTRPSSPSLRRSLGRTRRAPTGSIRVPFLSSIPRMEAIMDEVTLVAGEGDRDLRERLDQEIIAFNLAATGYHDARLLSIAARGNSGDLCAGLSGWTWGGCGRTPGYPNGYDHIHLVKRLG